MLIYYLVYYRTLHECSFIYVRFIHLLLPRIQYLCITLERLNIVCKSFKNDLTHVLLYYLYLNFTFCGIQFLGPPGPSIRARALQKFRARALWALRAQNHSAISQKKKVELFNVVSSRGTKIHTF